MKDDHLSRLHWDAICAQHVDPNSERTKKAIADYNKALDEWLDMLFKPTMAALDETADALPTPSLTLDALLQMAQSLPQVPPLPCPNPCDVHPQTYEQIKNAFGVMEKDSIFSTLYQPGFTGLVIHQRTDVEPGFLHPCRCQDPELNK